MPKDYPEKDLQRRYQWLRDITDEAIAQRVKVSEFHGLEQELRELQKSLIEAYHRSVQMKHPRDKGDFREEILKRFLVRHGLLPERYAVSELRVRAVAPSGHVSPELDIVIYNRADTIVLRRLEGTADYLPIECIHGAIQVKSKLTKAALLDGLDNIKKFKQLQPPKELGQQIGGLTLATGLFRRFGILFAYELSLEWDKVCTELRNFANDNPREVWPNLIFILNKGFMRLGDDKIYAWKNRDQLKVEIPKVYGTPDLTGSCLLEFYTFLIALLKDTPAGAPDLDAYLRMPLTSGGLSYSFSHGATAELLVCQSHGSYLKRITEKNLLTIITFSRSAERINWVRALDIAQGNDGANEEQYKRQPGMVRIYNPDGLPLSQLLFATNGYLAYDAIEIEEMTVLLPLHYIARDDLFEGCPLCSAKRPEKSSRALS